MLASALGIHLHLVELNGGGDSVAQPGGDRYMYMLSEKL